MEKNLFLNTFADVKQVSIETAKKRIAKMAWDILRKKLRDSGYTAKELKEAYEIFTSYELQDVYDSGVLVVSDRDYLLYECLA